MPDTQTTDAKMDQQTALLKWILGGVGVAILGLAGFAGSMFTTFVNRSASNEEWLKKDLKLSLDKQDVNQTAIAKTLDRQTTILEDIRNDQRKFPAVAEKKP